MPTLSFFYGIIISMYWDNREPPHFHAKYQDDEALFDLGGSSRPKEKRFTRLTR